MKPRAVVIFLTLMGVFLSSAGFFLWQERHAGESRDSEADSRPAWPTGARTPSSRSDQAAPAIADEASPQGTSAAAAQRSVPEPSSGPAEVGDVPVVLTLHSTAGDSMPAAILVNNSSDPLRVSVTAVDPATGGESTVQITLAAHRRANLTEAGLQVRVGDRITVQSPPYHDYIFEAG
ncbi:MAG: hypothetical protein M3N97_15675 [Pseudomonadota bacterium]|nr:hypothetical protein [Pseudomonadota bacterium]